MTTREKPHPSQELQRTLESGVPSTAKLGSALHAALGRRETQNENNETRFGQARKISSYGVRAACEPETKVVLSVHRDFNRK